MIKVVFSKSYCPYCKASKALLNQLGAKYYLLEVDEIRMPPFFFFFFFFFFWPFAGELISDRLN